MTPIGRQKLAAKRLHSHFNRIFYFKLFNAHFSCLQSYRSKINALNITKFDNDKVKSGKPFCF